MMNTGDAFLREIYLINKDTFKSNIVLPTGENKNVIVKLDKCYINSQIPITFVSAYGIKTYGDFTIGNTANKLGYYNIKYYHYYGVNEHIDFDKLK